ncbi:hypothetical protein JW948_04565 [bacterium]|nr:hypothetical protein [bacterium]
MKRLLIVAFALLGVTSAGFAGDVDFDKAVSGYIQAIQSDNSGLRYSAIYQVAQLKNAFPNEDFSRVERVLERVSKRDNQAVIRFHAGLVADYLKNGNTNGVRVKSDDDPMIFFNALHQEYNAKFLENARNNARS